METEWLTKNLSHAPVLQPSSGHEKGLKILKTQIKHIKRADAVWCGAHRKEDCRPDL